MTCAFLGDVRVLVVVEKVVRVVDGVSKPVLRLPLPADENGASSISKVSAESAEDRGDSTSLGRSSFGRFRGTDVGESLL